MTFSICVREEYEGEDGETETRYGVAVTTRLAAVGTLCPFASEPGSFIHLPGHENGIEIVWRLLLGKKKNTDI